MLDLYVNKNICDLLKAREVLLKTQERQFMQTKAFFKPRFDNETLFRAVRLQLEVVVGRLYKLKIHLKSHFIFSCGAPNETRKCYI